MAIRVEQNIFDDYKKISLEDFKRTELGIYGFDEVQGLIKEIKGLLDEIIEIFEPNAEQIPKTFGIILVQNIQAFISHRNSIRDYSSQQDRKNTQGTFLNRERIINAITNSHEIIFSLKVVNASSGNPNINPLISIYTFLKSKYSKNGPSDDIQGLIDSWKTEVDDVVKLTPQVKSLFDQLSKKATEEVVTDYAKAFQEQSEKHSILIMNWKSRKLKMGTAQRWFTAAIILSGFFIALVFYLRKDLDDFIQNNDISTTLLIVKVMSKFILLSFVLYLITYFFKQYSIHKHLSTVNQHRANALNSYKLFFDSIEKDPSQRNALMLEVAKAIYDVGQSGYLSGNDGSDKAPSFVEMTRFVNSGN